MRISVIPVFILLIGAAFCLAADDENSLLLFDTSTTANLSAEHSELSVVDRPGGSGRTSGGAIKLAFDGKNFYPGFTLPAPDGNWDLSKFGYVGVDVVNTSDAPLAVGMNVKNAGDWRLELQSSNVLRLAPGKSGTLVVTLGEKYGGFNRKFDPRKVVNVQIFIGGPKAPGSVVVSNVRAYGLPKPPPARFAFEPGKGPFPVRYPMLTFDDHLLKQVSANEGDVKAELVTDGDYKALRITTPGDRDWPGLRIAALTENAGNRWDLSHYQYISMDLRNVDHKDLEIYVRVDNPGANGSKNCITQRTFIQPNQRVTLTIPIKRVSDSKIELRGMIGFPQGLYPDGVGLDPTNIVALVPFTGKKSGTTNSFEISNVFAGGVYEEPTWADMTPEQFFPMVDRFGQFVHKDWPGKIHNDAELQQARETEAAALADDSASGGASGGGPKSWDKWGGWADGPTLEATGAFRVEKYNGRWWLVDPDGKLFFSTGLTGVGFGGASTPIENRENYFADLPDKNDPQFGKFFGKTYRQWAGFYAGKEPVTYDFSRANLLRKYGSDWATVYPPLVSQRLRAWGINTMGNWSDGRFMRLGQTPYTTTMYYSAPKLNSRGAGFPDVFDPKFPAAVAKGAAQFLKGTTDDPWCIGYFVDNEMPWGGDTTLARLALKAPATQAAKQKLVAWLTDKYKTVDAMNTAWGTSFADWNALADDTSINPQLPGAVKDLTDFTELIAETYFKTIRDALKAIAPNRLYLGCRSVGSAVNMARAAIKYCDVVSYNHYAHSVGDLGFPGNLDGPIIIGEFHFCATDRGLFWSGLVTADNQAERGKLYQNYVRSALDNPLIVGVHWFQYGDESVTGRGDGENAQCGFIDVCDTPYKETVEASRAIANTMYTERAGKP